MRAFFPRPTLIAAALAVVALGGCASWFEGSSANPPTPLTRLEAGQKVNLAWSARVGEVAGGGFMPFYQGGNVLAVAEDGRFSEWEASSGQRVREWRIKDGIASGVSANAETVFVGSRDGRLLALERASGKQRWAATLTSLPTEAPQLAGSVVIARTSDGRITGFDANDGRQLWSSARSQPQLLLRNAGSMQLVGDGALLVGQPAGRVAVLRPSTGDVLWESTLAAPRGATEIERVTDVVSRPVFDAGQVCAVAYQGRVGCLDARSGTLMWARELSSTRGLTLDERNLYVTADDGSVQAYDRATGRNLWQQAGLKYRDVSGPARLGPYLLVADGEGYVHLLSRDDGRLAGRLKGDFASAVELISLPDGVLLLGRNGRVARITLG
ncbi:Beta-barrel assembly machine subunit BamB [Crenobacter luteus]|uniref:outer membrane protein assembly factor BamB n=1 Tax=Crenobacter luteus TaxID=1452487 RepID=UPI001049FB6E|nr:outer membrane protein assembly factor BamB [Crenobacter luteus]TCP10816.1 Beta-barrel assembly machine subunit BamB [Crenobacter luteus]